MYTIVSFENPFFSRCFKFLVSKILNINSGKEMNILEKFKNTTTEKSIIIRNLRDFPETL